MTVNKEKFLQYCHTLYDDIHSEKKINDIFDIEENHLTEIVKLYNDNFIWREHKINLYLKQNTSVEFKAASLFYVNALQHYLQSGP
tara:strand:- start:1271 stop:1528 length:258 start_codon:yes stop_codon:yes gene_type:complete